MTEQQKRLKNRMESENGNVKVYTQAEFDRLYGKNKTKTGRATKKPSTKK